MNVLKISELKNFNYKDKCLIMRLIIKGIIKVENDKKSKIRKVG
jgi:hypothetical protein